MCNALCLLFWLAASPRFEVASVKPVEVKDPRTAQAMDNLLDRMPLPAGLPMRGRRVEIRGMTLEQLICAAYRIRRRQLIGPGWLSDKRFDVEALIPADAPREQANEMLQTLLEERFGLELHRATREFAGYTLTVAKGGANLKVSAPLPPGGAKPVRAEDLVDRPRKPIPSGSSHHEMKRCEMGRVTEMLDALLGAPVEDRTGLKERYDLTLDVPPPLDADDRDVRPRVLDAVKTLGLSLRAGKITLPVLIVDRVEKVPAVN